MHSSLIEEMEGGRVPLVSMHPLTHTSIRSLGDNVGPGKVEGIRYKKYGR